jgi:hypothetical protein
MAHIDWAGAVTGVDFGHLSGSSGETRILRLAASLAGGVPVNLGDAVTGLDHTNRKFPVLPDPSESSSPSASTTWVTRSASSAPRGHRGAGGARRHVLSDSSGSPRHANLQLSGLRRRLWPHPLFGYDLNAGPDHDKALVKGLT